MSESKIEEGTAALGAVDPLYNVGAGRMFPVDMTAIIEYEKLIDQITHINPINGPFYMMSFLKAKELAAQFHTRASYEYQQARDMSKKKYAIARLDKAPSVLKEKGLRVNEGGLDSVADQDPDYLAARNAEAYYKSLMTFLYHKVEKFQSAHDDAKKIFDQSKDPRGSSSAVPSSKTTYEGEDQ